MVRRGMLFIAIASTLLCLASVGGWVRSRYRYDVITYARGETHVSIVRNRDGVDLCCTAYVGSVGDPGFSHSTSDTAHRWPDPPTRVWSFAGIEYTHGSMSEPDSVSIRDEWSLNFDWWLLIVLTAVLPIAWLITHRRRHPAGSCRTCGYDLRATPDRCPECGTAAGVTA